MSYLHRSRDIFVTASIVLFSVQYIHGKNQAELHSKLFQAARTGDAKQVVELLREGADPATYNSMGWNFLTEAALLNRVNVVEAIPAKPDLINHKNKDSGTALTFAAQTDLGSPEFIRALLDKGADVKVTDQFGGTALFNAASGNTKRPHEIAKLLINRGAEVDARNMHGLTPLMKAAQYGRVELVKLLIASGADVNAKDKEGMSVLSWAAWGGEGIDPGNTRKCLAVLKSAGAK